MLLIIVGIVVAGISTGHSESTTSAGGRATVPAGVVDKVAGVPAATLTAVGTEGVDNGPRRVDDPALSSNGKPLVLYVGAEYCPFCAAERWPLVQALSRFGTFSGLTATHSGAEDVYPNTATFSFYGAHYQSDYLTFDGRELRTNELKGGHYTPLQSLDGEQEALFKRYGGGFPFLDLGGRFVMTGATYQPELLRGMTVEEIANSLANASSPVARAVNASANVLTAALCELTEDRPTTVCTAPAVRQSRNG